MVDTKDVINGGEGGRGHRPSRGEVGYSNVYGYQFV